ncbi:MAG TPA: hypothetical protein VNY55_11820 [Mycobacterium sp.]|jgi:hypothetical protein|nr:hypothetical protein [Mycobacterium sp.]
MAVDTIRVAPSDIAELLDDLPTFRTCRAHDAGVGRTCSMPPFRA